MESCLSHQSKKSDRFQRNRFTTCVWSCYDQQVEGVTQRNGDRYNLFAVDQWMPTFADQNAPFVIKDRSAGIHGKRQASSCKYEIQLGHDFIVGADLFHIISGIRTKPGKYHLDLFLFFAI